MIKSRIIIEWMFYGFVISSLIIPLAPVNKILFVGIVILYTIQLLTIREKRIPTIAPIAILMIYIYGYLKSFTIASNNILAFQFMVFGTMLFLIYPIIKNCIDMDRVMKIGGMILTYATFLLYIILAKEVSFLGSDIIDRIFKEYGSIAMGYRGFFGEAKLFVHFGSAPFLFLPGCLYLKDYIDGKKVKSLFSVLLIIIAMILSTSRALIVGFALAALLLVFLNKRGYSKIFWVYIIGIVTVTTGIYLAFNSTVFDLNEFGNSIKIGDARSFFDNLTLHNIFFGDGLASYYYASGRGSIVAHTENSLLDTVRYFGFILSIFLYLFLLMPKARIFNITNKQHIFVIFFIYLAMSLTNPIFFNSLGGLVILWYWSNILV